MRLYTKLLKNDVIVMFLPSVPMTGKGLIPSHPCTDMGALTRIKNPRTGVQVNGLLLFMDTGTDTDMTDKSERCSSYLTQELNQSI